MISSLLKKFKNRNRDKMKFQYKIVELTHKLQNPIMSQRQFDRILFITLPKMKIKTDLIIFKYIVIRLKDIEWTVKNIIRK